MDEQYALEIEWSAPDLPSLVGPFPTREEAEQWAQLNIPNGSWLTAPLTYPYAQDRHSTKGTR